MLLTEMRQIEEFLDEYRRSRVIIESTVRATLNRTLEFEDKLQKPFYEFSEDEILNIFKSFHNLRLVKNHDNLFMLFDGRITITVIVNKM